MAERDVAVGMSLIGQAVDAGADPRQLARELVDYVRGVLLFQVGSGAALTVSAETQADLTALAALMPAEQILRAIRLLNQAAFELRGSASPTLPLEMALVETVLEPTAPAAAAPAPRRETAPRPAPGPRATSSRTPIPPEPDIPPNPAEEQDTQSSPTTDRQDKPRARTASQSSPAEKKEKQPDEPSITNSDVLTVEMVMREWQNFLARVHKLDKTLDAWLRDAKPVQVQGDLITIGVEYDLHKKKVEDAKARPQVEKALAAIFGKPYHYKCILSPRKQKLKAAANDPRVRAALEMGGQIKDIEEEKP